MPNERADVFKLYDMSVGPDECWRWSGAWGGRTRTLRPYYQAGGVRQIAYRTVYELVHGITLTTEQQIRHSCDNGGHPIGCGNPRHLSVGTNKDNVDDRTERERWGLSLHVVRAIKQLLDQGQAQSEIARLYGLDPSTVSHIARGTRHG